MGAAMCMDRQRCIVGNVGVWLFGWVDMCVDWWLCVGVFCVGVCVGLNVCLFVWVCKCMCVYMYVWVCV